MSIPVAAIKKALYNWLKEELKDTAVGPEKIVWLDQDAPRPSRPYVGMRVLAGPVQVGDDEEREVSPGIVNVTGNRTLTFTVSVYGSDSYEIACKLHSSTSKKTVQGALYSTGGLSVVERQDVQNVTTKLDTKNESRFEFDTVFGCVSSVHDEVGVIEDVEVTNEIPDPDSTQVIETP